MDNEKILLAKTEVIRALTGITQMGIRDETKDLIKVASEKQIEIIKSIKFK